MAIKKQEFYEGAALHILARGGQIRGIRFAAPFVVLNDQLQVFLKYSTRGRSPWGFTFTPAEQLKLSKTGTAAATVIGLICGSDGVAALSYELYQTIAHPRESAIHVACYRAHGQHYEVKGPDGTLNAKIAPSRWYKLLEEQQ
ncbi:MAG: hypothetical protein AABO58_21930 [Acidobacteriota bacterium]